MWKDKFDEIKQEITDSEVLSKQQKTDVNNHLGQLMILFENIPSTLTADEAQVIYDNLKTVIHESTIKERSSVEASKARRSLLKAVHDKEDQAELLTDYLYEFCQILASLGV